MNHRVGIKAVAVLIAAVVAGSCDRGTVLEAEPTRLGIVPDVPDHNAAAVSYMDEALQNPDSWGNRHNQYLALIHSRIEGVRAKNKGRRVASVQACRIMQEFTAEFTVRYGQQVTPNSRKQLRGGRNRTKESCDLLALVDGGSSARTMTQTIEFVPVDWVDSVFAEPDWDSSDFNLPLPSDDVVAVEYIVGEVLVAMQGAASAQGVSNAVSAALLAMSITDDEMARVAGEIAGLAVSTSFYWEANVQQWVDEFCTPQDPNDPTEPSELCHGPLRTAAWLENDWWWLALEFAAEDVMSTISIGYMIASGISNTHGMWERAGQAEGKRLPAFREEVRTAVGNAARDRKAVMSAAGKTMRTAAFRVTALGAAIDSALGAM